MNFRALVIDMDGVLWRGQTALPGLSTFFEVLNHKDIPFVLATNNAMNTAADYVQKLAGFGVRVDAEQILTSAEATASYLRRSYPDVSEVYAVGEAGLHRALNAQGFAVVSPEDVRRGSRPPLVVTALARESLSYELLAMATLAVNGGAQIVATNADPSYPTELGMAPGAGALLSVITSATGKTAEVVGKPEPLMFQEALRRLGVPASDSAMVGDRLSTDIQGAAGVGMQTILVLSGVSSRADADKSEVKPDYVLEDIRELSRRL